MSLKYWTRNLTAIGGYSLAWLAILLSIFPLYLISPSKSWAVTGGTTLTVVPAAPTALTASDKPADDGKAVNLLWTPSVSGGAAEQRIYRGTAAGGPYSTLVTTIINNTTSSYTDNTGLSNGTTYYYVIRAFGGGQESSNSNEANAVPGDDIPPAAPAGFNAADVPGDNGGAIALNWTVSTSTDVTQQRIYRGTASGGPYPTLVTTIANNTTATYTDNTGLTNGTTYYYVIRAFDGTQESVDSSQGSAIPIDNPPQPPTGLSAADVAGDNGGAIALNWTVSASTDASQQRVYRGTATGGPYSTLVTTIANNTTATYTDNTGLTNGTTSYYVIRTFDGTQESGNSSEVNAMPIDNIAPNPPAGFSASDVAGDNGGAIVINWTPSTSTDVTQQRIYRGTATGGPYGTLVTTIVNNTTATYTDNSGLTNGTTYYYVIRAFDGTQESGNSTQSSAVPLDNIPPVAPTTLSAADVAGDNGGAIVLNWTPSTSTDATQQRLYRGTATGGPYSTLVTTIVNNTTSTYTDNTGLTNGTTYYYVIRAFDGTQESGNSTESSAIPIDNIAPNVPAGLSAADEAGDNGGAILLNWTVSTSTDVTQQRIYRGTATGGPYGTLVTTIVNNTTSTYTDNTGLINGTTYYYIIRAFDGTQESGNSTQSSAVPLDNIPPVAPTTLSAADVAGDNGGAVVLNWTPSTSTDVTQQRIYRGTATGGPYGTLVTTIANNTTSTYTDNTGLTNGTTYYYVLRAFDATQESVNSTEGSAIPIDNPPNAPAGLSAADVAGDNGGTIVLNWTPSTSTDVTQQRIYRGTATGGPYGTLVTTIANNTTSTYTDNTGLSNGTTYYYVIRAFDGTQESGNSSESSAVPLDNAAPVAPTLLSAADVADDNGGAIVLNWTPSTSTDVTQQRIYRGTATGGPYGTLVTTIANNTTSTYTDNTGLTNGTTYYYVIRTFDGTQESGNSSEASAVPADNAAPVLPTLLSAADVAGDNGGAIVLNWTPSTSTDVTQQRIYRGTATGGPYGTLVTTIANNTTSTYTDNTGLTNGTTYYYVIRAFDGTQESGNSIQASAIPLDNAAPVAPTLLSAADVAGDNGGAIVLNWTPSTSTDVTQQRIYRGTATGGPYGTLVTTIANNTTSTYTDNTGLTNGTTYYYVIRTFDGTQESGNSSEASAVPADNAAPVAPALLSAADVAGDNGGAVVLNWTPSTSTDVSQQRIYRGTATGGPYPTLVTTLSDNTTSTYTDNAGLTNGTTYYYVILAFDGTQESGNSVQASAIPLDNAAPLAPTLLSAADVAGDNGGAVLLNWTVSTSTDVTQQRIYRGTATGGPYPTLVTTLSDNTTSTYTDNAGLTNGTTYYYVIRAFDGTQESGNSGEASAIPADNAAPVAPASLSAADVAGDNGGAVLLNWTVSTSTDVTQQRIYRGTATGGPYGTLVTTIGNNTTSTYTDNAGLTNGTTYYYVIRAFDGTQESGNSSEASAIPIDNIVPNIPAGLSAADVAGDNGGAILLNWTVSTSTDIMQQRIYRGIAPGGPYGTLVTTIANNTTATYTDNTGLTNGTTYYYVILAFDGTQESGNSGEASAIPADNAAPVAPALLSAADVAGDNGGAVLLNWTVSTSTDVTQQRIYRGTATGGPYGTLVTTIANNTTSTYTDDTGLSNGTTYYYVIRAFDGVQESGDSTESSAVPADNAAPVAPALLSAADVAGDNGGAIVLNWTASTSTDVTQQRIYRGTATGGPYGTLVTTIANNTTSTYTDNTGLTNGTTYYYVIRAFDGTQESGNSGEASAIPIDNIVPNIPVGLSAADVAGDNGGAVVLNWTPSTSTDVSQQRIYRGIATGGPYSTLVTTIGNNTTATYTDNTGLTNGITYYYIIRAFDGTQESVNSNESSAIPIGPPSDTTGTISATTPVLANGVNTSIVTVTVKDASNNPISGATVTLSSSRGATDTITQPVGTTDINGQITGTVKSATAGYSTITALANGTVTLINTAAITFYNTVTGSNVVVSPDAASQVTFTNVNSVGITATQENPSGTPLSTGYGNPTYYDISTTAGYSGSVAICITYNEAQYTGSENRIVLLHNEAGTWVNRTSGPVDTVNNIVCGNVTSFSEFSTAMTTATRLIVTSVSQSVTAGQASNAVTVEAQDSNNVLDTSYGGSVSLSSDSPGMLFDTAQGGAFNGTITSITLSGGTGTFYFKDTIKGTPAITVSAAGLTGYQQSEDILSGPVNATQTTVTASLSSITANGTSTAVITVTPKDAYGNNPGAGQTVSLSRISGTGALLAAVVDNGDGTYTRSVQSSTLAGSGIFQAVVNSVTITQTTTVNYVAGPLHHYAVTATTPQTANKGWTETVTAEDSYNNLVSGDTSIIVLAGTGSLLFYTSSSYLTETTTTVLSGGLATLYLKGSVAETVSYTVTRQSGTETGASGNITLNAAPVITTASLPEWTLTVPYSQTLTATGGTLPVTWSIQSGSLPAGLNMSSGGVISGSPTTAGSYPFTVLVTDSNMATDSKALSIIINAAPTISTPGLPDGTVGASYNYTVTAAGGTLPLSWNVQTGTLPTGFSLASATGIISGTPVSTGTSGFSIRVTDANGVTNDKLLSIMIYGVISVSTTSLPDGTMGMGYSQTLIATGGKTPYNWSISTGSLPSGLTLNTTSGAISGTPSAAGTYNFTVQVQDTNGALATSALGITINDTLSIATTALSDGTINQSYTQTLTASGGRSPYTWTITVGTLPAGLTLNSGTGVISGTPTATGTSTFTVQVTDANSQIASKSLSVSIYAGVVVTTASLPDGTVTAPYSVTLTGSGGKSPYTWSITSGTLPAGLTLNTNTGAISGTPSAGGTYPITVQVTDDNLVTNTKNLSIIIYNTVSIGTVSLADGTINTTYNQTLSASGGKTPYLWSLSSGTLPSGLGLNVNTGVISGTPLLAGTSNFTVQLQDSNGAITTQALAITIFQAVSITTLSLPDGTVNLSYSQTLTATGGKTPVTWSVISGTLPAGISLAGSTGIISGTPTASGASTFTVQAMDDNGGTNTKALTISIYSSLSVSTAVLTDGTAGWSYSRILTATGGKTPYTWAITAGTLPAGLTLNNTTGEIDGTPTTDGTTNFTVQVTDSNSASSAKALSITIYTALSMTTTTLSDATIGAGYSQTLTASGGKLPYVWSITAGSLPAGLALNTSTGGISGTPTTAGTYNFTAQVTDANGAADSRALSIVVYSAPTITTASLSDGTVNLAYSQTVIISGGKSPFNWTILLGALPAGLTLNSGTGVISGTPTASGTSNFTLQATDANGAVTSKSLSINVYAAIAITTTSLPGGTRTAAYSQTIQASGGKSPVSWGVIAGSLPAGLTLNSSTGVIAGTTSSIEIANFTVQVSDSNGAVSSKVFSITINDIPAITTVSLNVGTAGSAYSQTLASSGGTVPLNWSLLSGSLPAGLTLNSATGAISGTPTVSGTSNFTVQLTDAYGVSGSKPLSITIAAEGPSKANILAAKTTIVADGTDSSTLTITVYDANNNLVADGTTVTLTTTNGTVTGTTSTVNGVVSRTINSTLSGTAAIGVESPSGTALTTITGNVSLNFIPGVPSQANISASKTSVVADGVDQTVLTITVRDANSNLAADGTTVTMTTTMGSVTGSGTTVGGVVTRYLSSLTSGLAILGVQSPTGTTLSTVTGNTNISFNAGGPAKAVISASKTTLIANGVDSSLLTVTVYDTNNNRVADGTTVTVTTTVGTVTGTGTTVNGVVTRVLTSTVSGTAVLGAEAPTGTVISNVTGNTTVVINPSLPAQANIVASKTTIIANGTDSATLTITVRDGTGNLVPDGTTVKLTSTIGTVTGSGTTVSGVVTRTLSGTVSGTAVLGVESPVGTTLATVTGTNTIILNSGPASGAITLLASPSNIEANGITTSTVTSGVIRDVFGNAVLDNTLVTVATDKGVITTADVSVGDPGIQVSTLSGVVTFVVRSSTVIGTANVTAQSVLGSASGGTQITFASGQSSSVNSTITATSPVYSDGVSASTVTITVRDANNNLMTGANVSLSSSRGVLDNITQPSGTTNINGQIIGTVASASTGNTFITATVNGTVVISETAAINFYNTMTGPNVTVTPSSDTQLTFDMVLTIGTASSTPVGTGPALPAGYAVPVYYDISTTATFSGGVTVCINYNGAAYGVREGLVKLMHDEGGVLVDRTTSINTATNTVCGSVTSFSIFATSVTTATKLQITSTAQTVSADNVSNIVTVEAQDNNGVIDPGVSGTVDVTSGSTTLMLDTSSTGTFAGNTLSVNIVNGIGNFYFKDTAVGTPTITVTDAGLILTPATQQQAIVPAVPSGTITLTPAPASIVADGLTTSTVTSGIISDAYGNTVSDGTLITVSTSRGTITTADASGGNPGIQVATVNGVISFTVQTGTVSGSANETAVSVQGSASGGTQITFLPGLPAGAIVLTPSPASITADGITASTVPSSIVTDAYGNTVSDGTLITVSTDMGTITTADVSGGNPGIQVATVNGVISFIVQSGTVSGTANVMAVSLQGSASGSTQITFLPGLPAGVIILTPNPVSIVADGFTTSTVTSGIISDVNGNAVPDGTLITVSTDIGMITTADASGVYSGIQVTTVSGIINFVVRSGTVSGVAGISAISVAGSAGGSTSINFTPGLPYGTISLSPTPAILPADGVSVSTVTSGVITNVNGNTVSDGTLITVSTNNGTIITADASPGTPGIQVATSTGIIIFTVRAGTVEGTATVSAASVQGSANGLATITLTNVPPGLFYPTESGYGNGDAVEPNSGLRSTVYKFKIVYNDVNNNPPSFMRICLDTNPCVAMGADTSAVNPTLRDGNYGNGEQYIYTMNNFISGDHTYYFETSDGLAYTKLPSTGSLSGPHVNYPPELSYSTDPGYTTDGLDPNTGNTTVTFKYKAVYRDLDNQAPSSLRVCIDASCYAMAVDTSAAATLHDGSYTNGEQYVYGTLLPDGTHNYYFDTSDGLEGALLPLSGNLSGPIVTSTYTAVGTNVVVSPATDITVTFTQVVASGDTYVTKSQVGSALPAGYLHGNPPAYFDIWSTATYTGKVKVCYSYNDATYFGVGYGGERGVRWLHYETGSFKDRTVMLDINNNVVCGEVYSFSEFSAAVEQATLVTLTSFKAYAEDGKVLLTWATASEIDSMGFNILRGTSPDGPFVRINDWVIMSKGSATRSMKYTYEDTGSEKGVTYFYKLENVDTNGRISAHMIASVTVPVHDASAAEPQPSDGVVTTPSGDKATTTAPGTSEEGVSYDGLPPVMETSPAEQGSGTAESSQENETGREPVTNPQTEEVLPRLQVQQPERSPVIKETMMQEANKELQKPFSLKFEDNAGNAIQVRLPENSEVLQEPFEITAGDRGEIILRWSASGNVKGYNILRSDGKGKMFKKVNLLFIPFFASQTGDKGLIYSFKDALVKKDNQYRYKIETILNNGTHKESKPVDIPTDTGHKTEKSPVKRPVSPKK